MAKSKRNLRFFCATVFAATALLFCTPLTAQEADTPAAEPTTVAGSDEARELTIADVEAALAEAEKDTGVSDAIKDLLRQRYKQAIELLKEAASNTAKAAEYRESVKSAPEQAARLREQLESLASKEEAADVTATGGSAEIQKEIDSRQAALTALSDKLTAARMESTRVKGRPVEISARLPEAQRELSDIRRRLASPEFAEDVTSPGRVVDRVLLQATESKLLSELEMLKQEQLSQSVREDLLMVQERLLVRQVENATAPLETLKKLLEQQLTSEARRVTSLVDTIPRDVPAGDQAAHKLATEVQTLARRFKAVVANSRKVADAQADLTGRLDNLMADYDFVSENLKLGGTGGAIAQVLFNLDSQIGNARQEISNLPVPDLGQTQMAMLEIDRLLRQQPDVEQQFADHASEAVGRLVTARRDVLEKLKTQYRSLMRALAKLEADQAHFLDKAADIRSEVNEQLFWMRSSPPINITTLTDIPAGLQTLFDPEYLSEPIDALRWTAKHMPIRSAVLILFVGGLLLLRPRIGAALEQTGTLTRRISTDRYAHTFSALFWTILLAVPIPLAMEIVRWALLQKPASGEVVRDSAAGLRIASQVAFAVAFLAVVCRPRGLGAAHFGWNVDKLGRIRRALFAFAVVYIPAIFFSIGYYLYGDASRYFDSVGRVVFMLAHLWTAIVLWRLCRWADTKSTAPDPDRSASLLTRTRNLWTWLPPAIPVALAAFASLGYLVTALELSLGLVATVALVAGGHVAYCLALRWFNVKQRKLALAEALQRRRERQEAAAAEEETAGEIVSIGPEDEDELDLESSGEQTHALLRSLFGLAVAVGIVYFWSERIPLFSAFDTIQVPIGGGLSLLGLAKAILVVVVTSIAVKNLPGLLDLAVLRDTSLEAGTRYAITTLCKYALIAFGLAVFFNTLNLDWAKFGWIAAALSVGLGFGLQEVVANFVCGLILLFERPIRVGDVVTLEGTTGTVTNINMRATTITNWDRQDLVVPNKNLITGTILNWTLSAPLNRVVIPVGVAYGTDTVKALQILLDVAANHPRITDEPAPIASFEQFADSSLTLMLRAYLPDMENRLGTITELHTEIDRRFAEAGIEIAFPQQDIHVRSGLEGLRRPDMDSVYGQGSDEA